MRIFREKKTVNVSKEIVFSSLILIEMEQCRAVDFLRREKIHWAVSTDWTAWAEMVLKKNIESFSQRKKVN